MAFTPNLRHIISFTSLKSSASSQETAPPIKSKEVHLWKCSPPITLLTPRPRTTQPCRRFHPQPKKSSICCWNCKQNCVPRSHLLDWNALICWEFLEEGHTQCWRKFRLFTRPFSRKSRKRTADSWICHRQPVWFTDSLFPPFIASTQLDTTRNIWQCRFVIDGSSVFFRAEFLGTKCCFPALSLCVFSA